MDGDECVSPLCRYVGNLLRSKLDFGVDPCNNFYKYVCGKFTGVDTFTQTIELVKWMIEMNLDFVNTTRLDSVDPVEMMVRGSLDLGVEAIISIRFEDRQIYNGKRDVKMNYSKEQETWLIQRSNEWTWTNEDHYGLLFLMSGVRRGQDLVYARKMLAYEERPEWSTFFSKYTDGIYEGSDRILHFRHSTSIIKKLFEDKNVGKVGLQYLVAWSIYRQLAEFTEPYLFRGDRKADEACFVHVKNVMKLAILSDHYRSYMPD
ncbi:hypothetical protein HPB52_020438 [Rhipicephalus sanguineus]|uniref:Uncharacterized protein n=1 Tax=Rhipicephalus sanguineus TaxID=34632 RepID=A0A9D4PXI3_RHISA|nr:hypothetical protein HPB52_020438 [Rhipicephalus sanguineus]